VSALTRPKSPVEDSARPKTQRRAGDLDAGDWRAQLDMATVPVSALLALYCCPAALWSADRKRSVFNLAARLLAGLPENLASAANETWLERVDERDQDRLCRAWDSLRSGAESAVCAYRFLPEGSPAAIEIEETSVRLARAEDALVLSRYRRKTPDERSLAHRIGNSLQVVRGEVDLLRLSGAVPRQSVDPIIRGIESIRELAAAFDERVRRDTNSPASDQGTQKSEVRRGHS
jgi:hypothetical protein